MGLARLPLPMQQPSSPPQALLCLCSHTARLLHRGRAGLAPLFQLQPAGAPAQGPKCVRCGGGRELGPWVVTVEGAMHTSCAAVQYRRGWQQRHPALRKVRTALP